MLGGYINVQEEGKRGMEKKLDTLNRLQEFLSAEYSSTMYSLDGYREDAVCLQEKNGIWEVYVGYRNHKDDLKRFSSLVDAGNEMIRLLSGGMNT